jgi:periplasmic protein CpxP/Spy
MKHTTKIFVLSLTISGLLTAQSALAESTNAAVPVKQEPVSETPKKCDHGEGKEKRLETLKSDLKLNASQEIAWTEWVGKIKGDHKDWEENRKNIESFANLPALERMEKMLTFSKEHIAKQESRLAATKTFYATLSPEQRQIFDKNFRFEHCGRFGEHWKK